MQMGSGITLLNATRSRSVGTSASAPAFSAACFRLRPLALPAGGANQAAQHQLLMQVKASMQGMHMCSSVTCATGSLSTQSFTVALFSRQ